MLRALGVLAVTALSALIFLLLAAAFLVVLLYPKLRSLTEHADQTIVSLNEDSQLAKQAIAEVVEMAAQGKEAVGKVNRMADSETKRIEASTKQIQKVEGEARLLVTRTNESLNGGPHVAGLFPQLTAAIGHLDSNQQQITDNLNPSLKNFAEASAAFSATVTDIRPKVEIAVDNTAKTTENIAEGTKQMAAIATDGRQIADKAKETYLKPVNLWYALGKEVTNWAFQLKGIF